MLKSGYAREWLITRALATAIAMAGLLIVSGGSSNGQRADAASLQPGVPVAAASVELPVSTPPNAVIYAPNNGALYFPGDSIDLIAFAHDAEDGVLGFSAFSWRVVTVICPAAGACAESVFFTGTGAFATMGAPAPSVPAGSYFFSRIEMTATDSDGDKTKLSKIIGPDADSNGCMDAYAQKQVFQPPFTLGAADHQTSGNAQNAHIEFTDLTNPAFHLTVSWAHVDSIAGTQGQEISFGVLGVPFSLTQAGDFAVTFDTDLFGMLAANATGNASGSSSMAVFGGVLSDAGVMIGEIELLQLERAYDDAFGAVPSVSVARTGHPYGFTRSIPAGSYHLVLVVSAQADGNTPLGAPTPSLGDGFAVSLTRASLLCELRAPLTALGGDGAAPSRGAPTTGFPSHLPPALKAFGGDLGRIVSSALADQASGVRSVTPEALHTAPPALLELLATLRD